MKGHDTARMTDGNPESSNSNMKFDKDRIDDESIVVSGTQTRTLILSSMNVLTQGNRKMRIFRLRVHAGRMIMKRKCPKVTG